MAIALLNPGYFVSNFDACNASSVIYLFNNKGDPEADNARKRRVAAASRSEGSISLLQTV